LGANMKIQFYPVPFTLQTFMIGLSALLFPKNVFSGTVAYIILGLAGLPLFASGGGVSYLFAPSFGYLVGMMIASFVLYKNNTIQNLLLSVGLIHLCGVTYLALLGFNDLLWMTMQYMPAECFKFVCLMIIRKMLK